MRNFIDLTIAAVILFYGIRHAPFAIACGLALAAMAVLYTVSPATVAHAVSAVLG
jgi:CBS-domain-containing membrane protein